MGPRDRGSRNGRSRGRGTSRGSSRGRGRAGFRGGMRGRGRGGAPSQRNGFRTSRVEEVEDVSDVEDQPADEEEENPRDEEANSDSAASGSEDETPAAQQTYTALLQALNARSDKSEPPRKKRRVETKVEETLATDEPLARDPDTSIANGHDVDTADAGLAEVVEDEYAGDVDSDEDELMLHDPFEKHYVMLEGSQLSQAISAVKEEKKHIKNSLMATAVKKSIVRYDELDTGLNALKSEKDLHLKRRLLEGGSRVFKTLSAEEKDLAGEILSYRDVQYALRTVQRSDQLRHVASLHALNHVFKTRDRVLKNNAKATQQDDEDSLDIRDQGFTRPKVLIIVPTKQACARYAESIAQICEAEQQENKSRFLETYSTEDDETWDNKPEDFRELFGGNHEEDFRVGLKFTRKTIKYFSGFYNSDIIFGSALGLMRTITTGGGGSRDKKKSHDADFLSSIEVVIVDHVSAIQMQNWQHLEYVFTQLNLLPKDSHGCDFSRVRNWYLDGNAPYLRQTILFTAYNTPEINALISNQTHNIAGLVKYTPAYAGAMLSLSPSLPFQPVQTFLRFDSPTPQQDVDARFTYFTTTILPPLLRQHAKGILLYIPTYADFTRLRNYFSTSSTTTSLSFGSISEYTPVKDVARARSHFMNGRHSLLIYSERAHHHFRYRLRGVKKIVFYGVPDNPVFWPEVVGLLGLNGTADPEEGSRGATTKGKGAVRALFSKWDVLKLERIVGTERVGRLVSEKAGDTFEFV